MSGDQPPESLLQWLQEQYPSPPQNLSRETVDARNSLDDVLRNDTPALDEDPEAIALPDSPTASSSASHGLHFEGLTNNHGEGSDASRSSLEVRSQSRSPVVPSTVSVPESRPSSRDQSHEETSIVPERAVARGRRQPIRLTYREILDNAGRVLDHIRDGNVVKKSRHKRTSITYYDIINDFMGHPRQIRSAKNVARLGHAPRDVQQRLVIVEDLSEPTIDALGATFSINPEFFEEHLLNSGYGGANYDDPPARTWKTGLLEKSYVSLRWIRPVYRLPTYFSTRDLKDLLDDRTEHFTRHGSVTTRVITNIFRLEWSLWTDPTKTVMMKRECGLEERVSIWKGKLPGQDCEIVVILLDPLPEITEEHRFRTSSHILKKGGNSGDDGLPELSVARRDFIEDGTGGRFAAEPQRVRDQRRLARLWADLVVRRRFKEPKLVVNFSETNEVPHKVIIEHIAPRQTVIVDLDRVFRTPRSTMDLGKRLDETKSTQAEICEALGPHDRPIDLTRLLFQIIRQDTLTLLRQLRRILDEVEAELIDDIKMEDRLALWRQLISRAQRELPELKTSMEPFVTFLSTIHPPNAAEEGTTIESDVTQDLRELSKDIDQTIDRLRKTSTSLTSNMALLDSRRSIDEARAVTRLTELAFIFIPLSFATSFFGMQVEPFANPVPIWNFFVVAIVVTAFSYLMRMTMRSQWLARLKAAMLYDVRKYAERHGQPVQPRSLPMFLIFQWLGSRLFVGIVKAWQWIIKSSLSVKDKLWSVFGFAISFILLNCAVSAAPIAILWTRKLDCGIQAAVSIAIEIVVIAFVGVPFWYRSEPGFRNALPELIIRGIRSVPQWARMIFLLLITTTALIAIPLVLIWTHPLSSGIKSGLTVGIVMIVIFAIGTVALWINTRRALYV
ncbi:hypothetical protein F1880_001417 [Penicillium rolfsii]|nr:hypothetical protein F1880_001417 [Penicillium rolfsii]